MLIIKAKNLSKKYLNVVLNLIVDFMSDFENFQVRLTRWRWWQSQLGSM